MGVAFSLFPIGNGRKIVSLPQPNDVSEPRFLPHNRGCASQRHVSNHSHILAPLLTTHSPTPKKQPLSPNSLEHSNISDENVEEICQAMEGNTTVEQLG